MSEVFCNSSLNCKLSRNMNVLEFMELGKKIVMGLDNGASRIILDFTEFDEINGFKVLVLRSILKSAQLEGSEIHLANLSGELKKGLQRMGIGSI